MKIAVVVKEHIETKGGLERYAVTLSRRMATRGHEVHVYANTWDPDDSLIFHYVPYIRWSSLLKVLSFPANARKHLKKGSFDLVYSLTPLYPVDIYRVGEGIHKDVLKARFPSPIRRFLRYLNPKHLAILRYEKNLFMPENFRAIITNSNFVKERLVSVYNVNSTSVNVIYNGFDDKLFNPDNKRFSAEIRKANNIDENEKVLLFAANDFKRKGLAYLIDALSILSVRGIRPHLLVVGKGNTGLYKRMAESSGIAERVSFAGPVADIEKYYGAADMFVLPTLYDPFSNACLEAFGSGLPVITTAQNGFSELIEDGVNGFVINGARSTAILADRIETLLNIPGAGERALKKAGGFTIDNNISKTLELCDSLISHGKVVSLKTFQGRS